MTRSLISRPATAIRRLGANSNTADGVQALQSNIDGTDNTATGWQALENNTSGSANTANGVFALLSNTIGSNNTADGGNALFSNTTGEFNTATGFGALESNIDGTDNTATGFRALESNIDGTDNTATGFRALGSNTGGIGNTAVGVNALTKNTGGVVPGVGCCSGSDNTAVGRDALNSNTTGSLNVAIGVNAGRELTTGSGNIDIDNDGLPGEFKTIRIGQGQKEATFIAGISGVAVTGAPVQVNGAGQLGTPPSSARFKDEIKPMDKTSEAILALKPVTFRYKKELDPKGIPQFGLVAEEVEKVNPDLITRDRDGKPYTVRYEVVNAMLLNEFLKEHQKMQKLEAALAAVNERLKEQDAKIDKVNAKVELTDSTNRVVTNE